MLTVTRKFEFDAGHRVLMHESKCKHLHGHRYVAEVTVTAPGLDPIGRVIDFGVLKMLIGGWIDDHWDHNMILHPDDPLSVLHYHPAVCIRHSPPMVRSSDVFGREPFLMPPEQNPTAENMAKLLFHQVGALLKPHPELTVRSVRLYETPNCYADYNGN